MNKFALWIRVQVKKSDFEDHVGQFCLKYLWTA